MPELRTGQPDGAGFKFFANDGDDSSLFGLGEDVLSDMDQNKTALEYGEYFVTLETLNFLQALEPQLGKKMLEDNLGTGEERIRLDDKGNIVYFDCADTRLSTLPELPASLDSLYCHDTTLSTIPELPAGLRIFYCSRTKIKMIPELPDSLKVLYCQKTKIKMIPELPAGLRVLDCSHNQISILPELPAGLETLFCAHTPLASDPQKRVKLIGECKARGIKLTI